jgi:ELWxxDGT repeat protein
MLKKAFALLAPLLLIIISSSHSQTFVKRFNSISSYVNLGNTLIFGADDGIHGVELWKTDGTITGTVLIKDINPGYYSSNVSSLFAFNGNVYFSAYDGINGLQVWQSDGTANGTVMLKNLGVLATGNGAQPMKFTIFNNMLYFVQTSDGITFSLWKTDGTANGTVQVTANDYSSISQLIAVGNMLYFAKGGLWQSDGTAAGTKQISVDSNQIIGMLTNVNNNLVFITDENFYFQNVNLYALSPSIGTPVLLQSFNPGIYSTSTIDNITAVGSSFFFSIRTVDANNNGMDALWKSDCTAAGTMVVKSFPWQSYISNSYMQDFVAYNNKLYFAGTGNYNLSTSDGTSTGTVQLANVAMSPSHKPIISNQKLYFNGNGQLWSFDGANAVVESKSPANPIILYDVNGKLYFSVNGQNVADLWNNAPAGYIQVTMNYQTLTSGGTSSFTSKADSTVTAAVTVTNVGNKALVFSEISVAGSSFYVNGQPTQTVLPGGQVNFNLLYSPLKSEQVNASLIIKSNDNSGQTNFVENLIGTATGMATNKSNAPPGGLEKAIVFTDSIPSFTLSQNTIAENAPLNTAIGTFSVASTPNNYQYQLTTGTGDADNGSFKIVNGQLLSVVAFNFNTQSTYTIRVTADNGTTSSQKIFAIQVTNTQVNLAPACAESFQSLTYSLSDVAYAGARIVAVATGGVILNSDDNGQTWQKINSGVGYDFGRVQFTDSKTGYIMGQAPPILKTEDGGNTWFPLAWLPQPQYASSLSNMYFVSASVGYVVTTGNAYNPSSIFKTTDGGRSWNELSYTSYTSNFYSAWFTDVNTGFICGSSGTLLHTIDGGNTWQTITIAAVGSNTPFNNITFISPAVGYMTSSVGDVLQTKDGGNTWARISTLQSDGGIDRIYFRDSNNGYALAGFNSANLYTTADGGITWNLQTVGPAGVFTGLAFNSGAANFCLVGHASGLGTTAQQGSVIYTGNGTGTWAQQCYFGSNDYVGGNLFANGTGYVFGASSLKTTDGGNTWKPLNISVPYPETVTTGVFLNASTGFYTDYHDVYKSIDGGNTWALKNSDQNTVIQTPLVFYNTSLGFYSNGQTLYRTTDGGETWSACLTPVGLGLRNISFGDQNTIYTTGIAMPLYKSTDGGNTWTSTNFGSNQSQFVLSLHFFDALNGLAGGTTGLLLRTTDGGQTWTQLTTNMQLDIMAFQFADKLHGYAYTAYQEGSGGTLIYETTDGGFNWTQILQPDNGFRGFQLNDGQLFMSGPGGSMVKLNSTSPAPVGAGYIAGDTVVASGVKIVYTVSPVQNTYYTWAVAGAQSVEYHNNQVIVSWQNGGIYGLQVTPYNSCATGQSRTINIDVEDMPSPQITGPGTVMSHATNVVYSSTNNNDTYSWATTGSNNIIPLNNQVTVNWGNPGTGTVTVAEANQKLNLQKSSSLNVIIQKRPDTSSNANLANLSISNGSLTPAFLATTTNYTALVGSNISSITVTPVLSNINGTQTVNGITLASGNATTIPLNNGSNFVSIVVTAPNDITKTYTINVTKVSSNANLSNLFIFGGALSPSFANNIASYTTSVGNAVTSLRLVPIAADVTSTIKVNGNTVVSGNISTAIPLSVGSNIITTTVTAQDGTTTNTYSINANRAASSNANLVGLTISSGILAPVFVTNTTSYTASVGNAVSSITLTPILSDVTATLTVNGTILASGNTPASVPLIVGSNVITVTITAQDGITTSTYTINVTRAVSSNANLASLTLSSGTLAPIFAAGTTSYTASVDNAVSSVTVTPTLSDVNASLAVNNVTLASGNTSAAIPLNVGNNTVTIAVTAQDGITVNTYTINVNRAIPDIYILPSNNFQLLVTSVTCKGSSDGSVNITAAQNLSYTATITGNGLNATYPFNTTLAIGNLSAGTYSVCLAIAGQTSYQQCDDLVITEPKDLSLYSTINNTGAGSSITLNLDGGNQYNIQLNGTNYTTSDNSITLPLTEGNNDLTVTTDRLCQGTIKKLINVSDKIIPYPLPFQNTLNLNIGNTNVNNVSVEIHNLNDGRLVYSTQLVNQSGVLQLDLTTLREGVYALYLTMDNSEKVFKIMK